MLDLSVKVFYKVHFDIEVKRRNASTFDVVIQQLKLWLQYKYNSKTDDWDWKAFQKYGEFKTTDGQIEASTTSFRDDLFYWACKIEEYEAGNSSDEDVMQEAPRIWTTEVGYEQISMTRATISCVIYYRDRAGFVGTIAEEPLPNVPSFVKNLLYSKEIKCLSNSDRVLIHAITIKPGEGKKFVERVMAEDRTIPYILVTPTFNENKEAEFVVEPENIAKNVIGNALVYSIKSQETLKEVKYYINENYECRLGQIMIYWASNSINKYRYITNAQIENLGKEKIINILRRVCSTDIKYDDIHEMFRMSDCDELYRQKRMSDLKKKIEIAKQYSDEKEATNNELQEQLKYNRELFEMLEEDNSSYREQCESLKNQLSDLKEDNWKSHRQIESMQEMYRKSQEQLPALNAVRSISSYPETAYAIGEYFQRVYPEQIDFSERGLKSLKSCSTRLDVLWECFYMMASYLPDLYRTGTADIEAEYKKKTAWDLKRGEGKMTRKNSKQMTQRIDEYKGREISIEPHVANGNKESDPDFVRVYFAYDEETGKIIIGHVGKHLDNYSTRKV